MAHKILVVDDDKMALTVTSSMLKNTKIGYEILSASDGKIAVEAAINKQPDLILMDWEMPEMSGIAALRMLKSLDETKDIPVIMQTGFTESSKLQEALDSGAVDYIRKPVDKTELLSRVKSALLLYDSYREIRTQKEQIQRQLSELEKLSLIAKETDNSVLLLDAKGNIEWVNEGFHRLYGLNLEGYGNKYGLRVFGFNPEIDPDAAISEILRRKKPTTFQNILAVENNQFRWVQTRITPIFNANQNLERLVAIESDITKLKEAENELIAQNQNLTELSETLKEVNLKQEIQNQEIKKEKDLIEQEKQALELQKAQLELDKTKLEEEKKKVETILLNILPQSVISQLKMSGSTQPRLYKTATVMFTDFKGFTKSCENLTPEELVSALHTFFANFDEITFSHFIEKIKTIGDAYMCVGGLPIRNKSNPFDVVLAGLEIQHFMNGLKEKNDYNLPNWQLRCGIHTGPVVAGVVGKRKFAYDVWGDTVNIAARMEQNGAVGNVNVSESTYEAIKDYFECEHRGKIEAKNKGKIDMYFVHRLKEEYAQDEARIIPNQKLMRVINTL